MRHAPVILVMLALLGACAPKGKYIAPPDTATARIEQVDRTVTYDLDPQLDALVVDFECSFMETLTYDYGDTIGKVARDTFERRFTSAVETDADSAEVDPALLEQILALVAVTPGINKRGLRESLATKAEEVDRGVAHLIVTGRIEVHRGRSHEHYLAGQLPSES